MGALSSPGGADLTINPTTETVRDLDLAQALGYGRPDSIRVLIKKKLPMLEQFGSLHRSDAVITAGKGAKREVTEFHLNRKQAIHLTTQAGTPKARAMTVLVVEVFDKFLDGKVQPVDRETALELEKLILRLRDTAAELE